MPDTIPACERCRFWVEDKRLGNIEVRQGSCQRYPPQLNTFDKSGDDKPIEDEGYYWSFPIVYFDAWCGEFQPKEQPPMPDTSDPIPADILDTACRLLHDLPPMPDMTLSYAELLVQAVARALHAERLACAEGAARHDCHGVAGAIRERGEGGAAG